MTSATSAKSAASKPLVASAGVPIRRPEVVIGGRRVVRHGVAVDRDADLVQEVLGLLAVERRVDQVDQHQVHIGAAGEDPHAHLGHVGLVQPLGEGARALQGAALAVGELGGRGVLERHGLARDHVLQRAALLTGEHRRVDLLGEVGLVGQDHAAARAAQGLVRRGGDHVRVRHRAGVQARRDQTGEVRHVHHEERADLVGDPAELGEVQLARVGRPARHDQLRPVLLGQRLDLGQVDQAVAVRHVVGHHVVELAGEVDPHPVREVPAVRQVEAQDGVAGLEQREHRRRVGLRARVRLHVREARAEQLLHPRDRQPLDVVDVLAAAVVAAAGVALGVLVGQHRALGLEHRDRREVLGGDHLQRVLLAGQFGGDGLRHLRVELGQGGVEVRGHGWAPLCHFRL